MGMNFSELENNSAKRLMGIGAVILLHLIVGYILMSGLGKNILKPVEKPVELQIIQEIKPPEPEKPKEKPPEPPKIVEKVLKTQEVQKPVEKIVPVQKSTPTVTAQPTQVSKPTPTPSPSPSPVATPVVAAATPAPAPAPKPTGATRGVSQGEAGCKRPDYPRESLMNEEQGEVLISVYVDANGKVKEAKVKRSSGSKTLDKAASKAFSLCSFKPAMKDGEAQESWYDIPYEFVLN